MTGRKKAADWLVSILHNVHLGYLRPFLTEGSENQKIEEWSGPKTRRDVFQMTTFAMTPIFQIVFGQQVVTKTASVAGGRPACHMRHAKAPPILRRLSLDYYWSLHRSTSAHAEALHPAVETKENTTRTLHVRMIVFLPRCMCSTVVHQYLSPRRRPPPSSTRQVVVRLRACRNRSCEGSGGSRNRHHHNPIPSARGEACGALGWVAWNSKQHYTCCLGARRGLYWGFSPFSFFPMFLCYFSSG